MNIATRLANISGALKDGAVGMYGSFHYDNFNHPGMRNTLDRLDQFNCPESLTGKTVLDIGSNTGAIALELARRGAKVVGIEYNSDRVNLCNELAEQLGADATFKCIDLNQGMPDLGKFDIVCCLAVDAYIPDRFGLYDFIMRSTLETCYLESNYPSMGERNPLPNVKIIKDYFHSYFRTTKYIGQSTPNGRRIFCLSTTPVDFPRTKYMENNQRMTKFSCYDEWADVKEAVELTHGMKEIPRITFPEPCVMGIDIISDAHYCEEHEIASVKEQLFSFVHELNKRGVAHRDIHYSNIIVSGEQMYVVDWEWATKNKSSLEDSYDVSGKGCEPCGLWKHFGVNTLFNDRLPSSHLLSLHLGFTKEDLLNWVPDSKAK